MRLKIFTSEQKLPQRVRIWLKALLRGKPVTDLNRFFLHRPEFFGKHYFEWFYQVMSGESDWTPGEKELFATLVSTLNQCSFCSGAHRVQASNAKIKDSIIDAVTTDWRKAQVNDKLKAAFRFLEQLTIRPQDVSASDITSLRSAGISEAAIEDLIHICALYCTINRIANALDFRESESNATGAIPSETRSSRSAVRP
jgi:uncharacterized peroxidase-related enzyme